MMKNRVFRENNKEVLEVGETTLVLYLGGQERHQ